MGDPVNSKKVNFTEDERLELVDVNALQDLVYSRMGNTLLATVSRNGRGMIFDGFLPTVASDGSYVEFSADAMVAVSAEGQLILKDPYLVYRKTLPTSGGDWHFLHLHARELPTDTDARVRMNPTSQVEEPVAIQTRKLFTYDVYDFQATIASPPSATLIGQGALDGYFKTAALINGQTTSLIPLMVVHASGGTEEHYDRRPMFGVVADLPSLSYPSQLQVYDPFTAGAVDVTDIRDVRAFLKALAYTMRQAFRHNPAGAEPYGNGVTWSSWARVDANGASYVSSTPLTGGVHPSDIRGLIEVDNDVINAYKDPLVPSFPQTTLQAALTAKKSVTATVAANNADFSNLNLAVVTTVDAGGGTVFVRTGTYTSASGYSTSNASASVVITGEGKDITNVTIPGTILTHVWDLASLTIRDCSVTFAGSSHLIAGELTLENAALASTLSVNVATKLSMTASSLTGDVEFLSNFNVQMQGSTVTGCLDGNSFVASGSVENCILTGSGSPAYCVYNWKTQRLRLKGNYFAGHVVLLSGANTDISDNEIVGYLTTTGAGYPVDDLRIVHNLIHGGTASTPLLIDVSGDTWVRNLLIENNHVYDNVLSWNATPSDHRAGIYCKFSSTPTGPLIRGVALRGNTVENNLVPAGTTGTGFDGTHGYFGICVGSTDYTTAAYRTDSILIEGNTVKNNGIPDSVDINGTPNGVSLLEPRRMSAQIFVGGGDSSMPGSVKIVNNYVGSYGAQGVGIFIADICHKTGSTESHYYPYRTTIENNTVFMSGALASAYQQLCSILYDGLDNVHDDYPVSIYKGVVTIKSNTVSDPYLYGDTSVNPAGQSAINITPYQNGMAVALASVSNLVFEGNSIYAGSASANKGSLECYLDPILGSLVTDSLVIVGNSCLGTGSYNGGITTLNAASNVIIANNYGTIV